MGKMQNAQITTDHNIIREWIESRGGIPGRITAKQTPTEDEGVIDIRFPDSNSGKNIIPISWDEFFSKFDQSHLAFEYESERKSKFFKFIWRNGE